MLRSATPDVTVSPPPPPPSPAAVVKRTRLTPGDGELTSAPSGAPVPLVHCARKVVPSAKRNWALPFRPRLVNSSVAEFGRRQEWLAARGIGYVVMVVPEKFTIYPEYLPSWVARSPSPTPHDQLSAAMRRNGRVAFIDLREPLRAAKVRERVYYQTDSHWNFNGAIVGYEALMREVQRALPDKLPCCTRAAIPSGAGTPRGSSTAASVPLTIRCAPVPRPRMPCWASG